MTSRERLLATLNRQPTDRLAVDLWHTPEVGEMLRRHCGAENDLAMYRALGIDKIVWVFMSYNAGAGQHTGTQVGGETTGLRTTWGVPLKEIQAGAARYHEFGTAPLAGYDSPSQLDDFPYWPQVERFDYDLAEQRAREAGEHFGVIGPWVSLFEIYCQLRGLEQSMIDLATEPELVDAILDRIEDIQSRMLQRLFSRSAKFYDLCFFSDDIAGQNGLLMSPTMWRRHLQPRAKRWCDLIHSFGLKVFYHTDGAAESLIEPLIECGIDALNPIQHACPGMETAALKRKYGDRLIFHGGVDNQSILPRGTPEDVRREVLELNRTLGADQRGFICASCHNVQPGTPLENILAMIETAKSCTY